MLVERFSWRAKLGHQAELVALLRDTFSEDSTPTIRVYTPLSGPRTGVIAELEYESWEARDRARAKMGTNPKIRAFIERELEIVENETTSEFLELR